MIKAPASEIFAGQTLVGRDYAIIKSLLDAGLRPDVDIAHLKRSELEKLTAVVIKNAKDEVPAVISPQGRLHILDGHHDIFMLGVLGINPSTVKLNLKVIEDFRNSGVTPMEFKNLAIQNSWIYAPSAEAVLSHPMRVWELANSPERTQMGLAFLFIRDSFTNEFRGKHFSPFIQFRLIDQMRENNAFAFSNSVQKSDIALLATTIVSQREWVEFLRTETLPHAPPALVEFLNSQSTHAR